MAKKNAFLQKMQYEKDMAALTTSKRFGQWMVQAGTDALVLTLGYDDVMKGRNWGEQRIREFGAAWATNLTLVMQGMGMRPDADAIRAEVDKLVRGKTSEERFVPWENRYQDWQDRSVEAERKMLGKYWEKTGQTAKDDGGTSELLKGVGRE